MSSNCDVNFKYIMEASCLDSYASDLLVSYASALIAMQARLPDMGNDD